MKNKKNVPDVKTQVKTIAKDLGISEDLAVKLAEKCDSTVYWQPYGGATSFDQVDQMEAAQDFTQDVNEITGKLQGIMYNINNNQMMGQSDKTAAMKQAADDFGTRLSDLQAEEASDGTSGEDKTLSAWDKVMNFLTGEKRTFTAAQRRAMAKSGQARPDGSYPIANRSDLMNAIRAWGRGGATPADKAHIIKRARALGATDALPADWAGSTKKKEFEVESGFKVFEDEEGNVRWISFSSNAFEDREHELFTTKALEEAVEYADKEDKRGPLLLYHIPTAEVGQCDFQAVQGRFLIESGTFNDTPMGQKALDYLMNTDEEHQVSIGYTYQDGDEKDGQYDWLRFRERSICPSGTAANPWTEFSLVGDKEMNDNKKSFLTKVLGQELADGVIAKADTKTKELEGAGVRHKEMSVDETEAYLRQLAKSMNVDPDEMIKAAKAMNTKEEETAAATEEKPVFDVEASFRELTGLVAEIGEAVQGLQTEVKAIKEAEAEKSVLPRLTVVGGGASERGDNIISQDKAKEMGIEGDPEPNPVSAYVNDLLKPRVAANN